MTGSPSFLPCLPGVHPREIVVLFLRDRLATFSTCVSRAERAAIMCEIFLFLLEKIDVLEAHFMGSRLLRTIYNKCEETIREKHIMHHPVLFTVTIQLRNQMIRLVEDEDHDLPVVEVVEAEEGVDGEEDVEGEEGEEDC